MITVYLATSPSGKHYVGVTSNYTRRQYAHYRLAMLGSKLPFHRALNKYKRQVTWTILDKVDSKEEAFKLEKFYIVKYNSQKSGYNVSSGGEGTFGVRCSDAKKELHRNKMIGLKRSESNKTNCSIGKNGKCFKVTKLNGELVGNWQNLRQCGRDLKIPKPHIWRCLRGLRKSTRGLKFSYIEVSNDLK